MLVFLPASARSARLPKRCASTTRRRRGPRCSRAVVRGRAEPVFEPHGARRIVLATNVAETSLTVPGIRYVIDPGLARVKRYSYRNKVEQLLIEPSARPPATSARPLRPWPTASASGSTTRRTFNERPRFTDPKSCAALAGVILRMKALHLGDVEASPSWSRRPRPLPTATSCWRAGRGGRRQRAHAASAELSRLPLDPRVGRMILEARHRGRSARCWSSPAAERPGRARPPMESRPRRPTKAQEVRRRKSEFMGYLKLWKWLDESRGWPWPVLRAQALSRKHEALRAELRHRPPRARVARRSSSPAAHRRGRARLAPEPTPSPPPTRQLHLVHARRACSATSAARATTRTGTWARAASSSGATRART